MINQTILYIIAQQFNNDTVIFKRIDYLDAHALIAKLPKDGLSFLESSGPLSPTSRYSYIAFDPVKSFYLMPHQVDKVWPALKDTFRSIQSSNNPDLPPFQGGIIGALSYDFGVWHILKTPPKDQSPIAIFGVYDLVIAYDRVDQHCWLISTGVNCLFDVDPQRAKERFSWALSLIHSKTASCKEPCISTPRVIHQDECYKRDINTVRKYIEDGDIFQANLTQMRLSSLNNASAIDIYSKLIKYNPAPFSALMIYKDTAIISSSPERFTKLDANGCITTSPIKGTCSRSTDPEEDKLKRITLQESQKDRKENIMIVDLMRNDVSKVSEVGSVQVPELNQLQSFQTVHHLVSTIHSQIDPNYDAIDLLQAIFPGGSITGAPKYRAMEIIDELEHSNRGFYCGSIFYLSHEGQMDSSILIRTIIQENHSLHFHAGGGITWDSDAQSELDECITKFNAITQVCDHDSYT